VTKSILHEKTQGCRNACLEKSNEHPHSLIACIEMLSAGNVSSTEFNATWADFDPGISFNGELRSESRHSSEKKSKKKSKKSDRSDGSGKKKKKKSKKSSSNCEDDDLDDFESNSLFEKAIAKAQTDSVEGEFALTEAFQDMLQDADLEVDQAYIQSHEIFDKEEDFAPYFLPEQKFQGNTKFSTTFREDAGNDEDWIVDNNSRGAQMREYSLKRSSVANSISSKSDESNNDQGRSSSSKRSNENSKHSKSTVTFSNDTPKMGSTSTGNKAENLNLSHRSFSKVSIVDTSSFNIGADQASGSVRLNDSATIHSDLTGLTGVFSMIPAPKAGDDNDDDSESESDESDAFVYPRYDPSQSKLTAGKSRPKTDRPKQKVQFGSVTVRGFERILGDNPSCKVGPPISIGWKVESVTTHPSPEAHDFARGRPIRSSNGLILSRDERHELLRQLGYAERDIANAVRAVLRDKNRRRTTVTNLSAATVEEKMETVSNGIKRMLFLKKS
jgi:hypothetical protein